MTHKNNNQRARAIMRVIGTDEDGHTETQAYFNGRSWYEYQPPTPDDLTRVTRQIMKRRETEGDPYRRAAMMTTILKAHGSPITLTSQSTIDEWVEAYRFLYTAMEIMFIYAYNKSTKKNDYELVRRWDIEPADKRAKGPSHVRFH